MTQRKIEHNRTKQNVLETEIHWTRARLSANDMNITSYELRYEREKRKMQPSESNAIHSMIACHR